MREWTKLDIKILEKVTEEVEDVKKEQREICKVNSWVDTLRRRTWIESIKALRREAFSDKELRKWSKIGRIGVKYV